MPPKYFYYHKPKTIFVTIFLLLVIFGLGYAAIVSDYLPILPVLLILLVVFYFAITDALIPMAQNKAVLIVDEKGITDIVSWGLIEWSNIKEIRADKIGSTGQPLDKVQNKMDQVL